MRCLICLLLLCAWVPLARAQAWDELLRQQATQKAYLREQEALLQTQATLFREGYRLADRELRGIHASRAKGYLLDQEAARSRQTVSPSLRAEAFLAEGHRVRAGIQRCFQGLPPAPHASSLFALVRQVRTAMETAAAQDLAALQLVSTPGRLELAEGERLRRLQLHLSALQGNLHLSLRFAEEVRLQLRRRHRGKQETAEFRQRVK
jgi:hypothetical protein